MKLVLSFPESQPNFKRFPITVVVPPRNRGKKCPGKKSPTIGKKIPDKNE